MGALLIFDLDGTLIDSRADICTAVNLTRAHYRCPPLPLDTVTSFVGDGTTKLIERALKNCETDIEAAMRIYMCFYTKHLHDATCLYPGVNEGLRELFKQGHTITLLSNKPFEACRILLRHFRVFDLFTTVLGGESSSALKPDPASLLAIMRTEKFNMNDTWMIGDNYTDIEAANRAGVKSVLARYGFGHANYDYSPTKAFDSFDEITRFFVS